MEDKKVMIFGTFDILHAGHENLFKQVKELGAVIIAVIARDNTVKKLKGEFPQNNESKRIKALKESGYIDKIVLGDLKDKYKAIKKYKPEVIALGYDQFAFTYQLSKLFIDEKMNTTIYRLKPYKPRIYKSSLLKENYAKDTQTESKNPCDAFAVA
ncbi:MAG: adenylyltransferase/cytidyltransferase family protein [Patescibacteria group bacterium]|nr:adenylyltransferase/cytidyltransferase family protein [Patescibacteria group bacterium]